MKKSLKIWLIALVWIILVSLTLVWFKAKIIPNWLEIEILSSEESLSQEKNNIIYDYSMDDSYVCPEWYKYWVYINTIKWYRRADIKGVPNRNSSEYEKEFKDWQRSLKREKIREFTFGPFKWCIPENWNLELCTDSGTSDYVFCTINIIPLNNECPEWYRFYRAWIVWPYDLCMWEWEEVVDSKWYIYTDMIPLQDECVFFKWMWILPADGHCD